MVLGAGGQLGREWVRFLKSRRQPYHAFDSSRLDITDSSAVTDTISRMQPAVVINCAAYSRVDQAEKEYERAKAVNADAVATISAACRDAHAMLLHFSTDYVFPGQKSDRAAFPQGYRENDPVGPVNAYGKTKLAGEEAIRNANKYYLIVRLSWLNGMYGNNFVKTMLRLGSERETIRVVNDQFGSPTFTGNVVRNCWNLLEQRKTGLYHLTSGGIISWFDFAVEIFRMTGLQVSVEPISSDEYPTVAKRPYFSKLCTEKIDIVPGIELTGWKDELEKLMNELNFKS